MNKTTTKKPRKSTRSQDLFGTNGVETTLPVISDEQLSTVAGGESPKLPKYQGD